MFTSQNMKDFIEDYGIKLLISTQYYAQANRQAEASNNVLIGILEKMIDWNPRKWHLLLLKTLWTYRTSKWDVKQISFFTLTYGYDAILLVEVVAPSLRVFLQNSLTPDEYTQAMAMELEDLDKVWI